MDAKEDVLLLPNVGSEITFIACPNNFFLDQKP